MIGNERAYGYDRLIEICKGIIINGIPIYNFEEDLEMIPFDEGSEGILGKYTFSFDKK